MIRVFLLDDHEIVRRGVRDLLESAGDIEVVAEAATAAEARSLVAAPGAGVPVDVAVLDVRLPDGNGVEVCRDIRSAHPEIRCLMLTSFTDDEALLDAIIAGASGYVLKQIRSSDLVEAVRQVAAGESLLDAHAADAARARLRGGDDERLRHLTDQELRILGHLADGMTNRQIAAQMFLAEKTIKNYVSNVLAKLGMARRTEAAVYAVRLAEQHKRDG